MILLLVGALICWLSAAFHISVGGDVDKWILGWCFVIAYAIAQGWPWTVWPTHK